MVKRKRLEPKLYCPECGKEPEPNSSSTENWNCYDVECPDCKVRYTFRIEEN